jgi:3-oxoacyl-[acyl-carrier-protein] synthase III
MTKERLKNVGIIGLGSYVPRKILTNKDLEGMVDTDRGSRGVDVVHGDRGRARCS